MTQDMGNKIMTRFSDIKTGVRLTLNELTARASRDYGSLSTRFLRPLDGVWRCNRLVVTLLLMLVLGVNTAWGQTTYTYYAIHNSTKGYLKQVNGGIATDGTFRYENAHDGNGSSIWILSSDGYLQQEMYYLNVAGQTLYLSTSKVTQWDLVDDGTKKRLQMRGTTKILGLNDATPVLWEPGDLTGNKKYKYAACEMTITENGTKWAGPTAVSFTVQSPQLVTYLRTYYTRSIIATISKTDAGDTNKKVVDKKDSRCYCSLTYSTTSDANKGTDWDINEAAGVIYNKKASSNVTVAATYTVAALDPKVLSIHPATTTTVTLTLQPLPFTPEVSKNYLLFYTKDANYRFPYDNGTLTEGEAVKTDATKNVLTEPANNDISWKVVRDANGFYSFQNATSGRWLRFNESHYVEGSNYGVVEVGVDGTDAPTDASYKFRLYKSGTYGSNNAPTYCILPYSKQFAVFKSDGILSNNNVALNVYKTPKAISLYKAGDDSKYSIFAYEAENRIKNDFSISGPSTTTTTGNYDFKAESRYFRAIIGSSAWGDTQWDLMIKDSEDNSTVSFNWTIEGLGDYVTSSSDVTNGKGTLHVNVTSLPTNGSVFGTIKTKAKGGNPTNKWSGEKSISFVLYPSALPTPTSITTLAEIDSENGAYKLTADIVAGDVPRVENFSGFLDGDGHHIASLSAPLFTKLSNATVRNLNIDNATFSQAGPVGALASTADGGSIIYNIGLLGGSVASTDGYCGGLVGKLDGSARVINCFSYANITGGTSVGGIVGYNNVTTTSVNQKTMVMNCMFYGDITGGSSKAPIYNGKIITNRGDANGVSNFNYFWAGASYVQERHIDVYNCALAAETRFLQRFEFFRNMLNSNRELAAWWATGSCDNKDDMMKWVLETADRQIDNPKPYPILKPQDKYPSIINIDAEHAPDNTSVGKNKGGKLGKTLTVHIGGVGDNAPSGASIIRRGAIILPRTDKDFDRFNFNYDKIQLPYYNDVGTGNYTDNKVVTGWEVSVSGGANSFSTGSDASASVTDGDITLTTPYNFADRKSTEKDNYETNGNRIFNQGAYFDVPEGVTSITIKPHWAKCVYVSDAYPDVVYDKDMGTASSVTTVGGGQRFENDKKYNLVTRSRDDTNGQKVYTSMGNAVKALAPSGTVYDNAIVLVGNVHSLDISNKEKTKPFTIMSIDLDKDNEPDYSYILRFNSRVRLHPVRVDFINIIGLGMAQKSYQGTGTYNFGIMQPLGWFESTNTSLFRVTQFEYDNAEKNSANPRQNSPMILQGGVIEQWVTVGGSEKEIKEAKSVTYYHVGGNVWFKEFHIGVHQDKTQDEFVSPHPPISVTGGDFNEFYLTGLYNTPNANSDDNAECYINGGHFGKVAGTGMQGIGGFTMSGTTKTSYSNGNIIWQIDNADIDEFYAGGINAAHIAEGNIYTVISNSRVDQFCGGPKFGDMNSDKKVVTNATNCTFRTFFGAGYGGNSYNRYYPSNKNNVQNLSNPTWDGWLSQVYKKEYNAAYNGVQTRIDYQFLPNSGNTSNVARLFVDYVSFSLATTYDVTSKLTGCTITKSPLGSLDLFDGCIGNFYGGGSLGKVNGNVKSTLTNCNVEGSAFGAGYSATRPTVAVMNNSFQTEPYYDGNLGAYLDAVLPTTKSYTWQHADVVNSTNTAINATKHILYTTEDLTTLGAVTGNATLNIGGTTSVAGSVYGGGEESGVNGNTTISVTGGTIGTVGAGVNDGNVYGGGKGKKTDEKAGLVKGKTNISISGSPVIKHNVYGGGAYGSVGTFTYNATTGLPESWDATNDKGSCTVTITGGTIGTNGHENGMVFGSSRGDVGAPGSIEDKMAWVYSTQVTIGDATLETAPTIKGSIYGGGENGHVFQNAVVDIAKGTVGIAEGEPITSNNGTPDDPSDDVTYSGAAYPYRGNVYGGGCGTDTYGIDHDNDESTPNKIYFNSIAGVVWGDATVNVTGGHVVHNVYGGGAMGSVGKFAREASDDNNMPGKVTGLTSGGTCTVTISGGTVGNVGATMTATGGPDDFGHVFGGGRGEVHDLADYPNLERVVYVNNTSVTISNTAFVTGSVYGGSESGHVLGNTSVAISGGQIGCGLEATGPYSTWDSSVKPTAHWTYENNGHPYDPNSGTDGNYPGIPADDDGPSARGGLPTATDGHTFYGNVFGGGSGYYPYAPGKWLSSAGRVEGTATVTITGGHILNNVYGGCEMADIEGAVTVSMSGGTVGVPRNKTAIEALPTLGHVYGAGMGDKRIFFNTSTNVASTNVSVTGGTVYGSVYGGGEDGHVLGNAVTTISKETGEGKVAPVIGCDGTSGFDGNVFGGGQGSSTALTAGVVGGNTALTIRDGTINGSVYGGGRIGSIGTYFAMADNDNYGKMQDGDNHGCIAVNLTGGTIEQNVYGGCMGTTEDVALGVSKNVVVNLNGIAEDNIVADNAQGCVVKGSIFGCNNVNSSPEGTVVVHVYGTQHEGKSQIANTAAVGETPAVTDAKTKGSYDVTAVYGGGNMAAYIPKDLTTGTTTVIIDGCDRTSIKQVYGGGNAASTPATNVTVNGTYEIEEVFGGGNGKDKIAVNGVEKDNPGANVGFKDYSTVEPTYDTKEKRQTDDFVNNYVYGTGKASVNIFGGTVHRVFGGSNTKGNVRQTAVTMLEDASDCEFCVDEAYGGGKSAEMDAEAKLLMACIPGLNAAYGGAEAADVHGNVTLNITNGTFYRVFGGNNIKGTISGSITVNISEVGCKPIIIGELYGGGNLAGYSVYGYNSDGSLKESGSNPYHDPQVNVKSFTSIGTIYGGGYGSSAVMVGNPTVNVSVAEGDWKDYVGESSRYTEEGYTYNATGYKGETLTITDDNGTHNVVVPSHDKGKIGAINNVFGGGNAAKVIGNTNVNIGTLSEVTVRSYVKKAVEVGASVEGLYTRSGEGTVANPYRYTEKGASDVAVEGITYYEEKDVEKDVLGVDIRGNVYGGGNNAEVTGNTNVQIGKKNE